MVNKRLVSTSIRGQKLVFNAVTHQYLLYPTPTAAPVRVPSATTVLSVLAKPGLQAWALNRMGDYILEHYSEGMTREDMTILVQEATQAHRAHSARAADIGTAVHRWIEMYLKGLHQLPPEDEAGAAIRAWLDWWDSEPRNPVSVEDVVAHSGYLYAGKFDLILRDKRGLVVVDIKTSSGIYPSYILQLGAYALAIQDWLEMEVDRGLIVRVGRDGQLETAEYDLELPMELFRSVLNLFWFVEEHRQTSGAML